MKVSIIVPFRDECSDGRKAEWFQKCIESIHNQSLPSGMVLEPLFVPDRSCDGSIDLLKNWYDPVINSGCGVVDALNKGLEVATGNLIGFCSADDWLYPNYVTDLSAVLRTTPIDIVGGYIDLVGPEGMLVRTLSRPKNLRLYALKKCPLTFPMMHSYVYKTLGGFPKGYDTAEDYAYWIRVLQRFMGTTINSKVAAVRKHDFRVSVQQKDLQIKMGLKIQKEAWERLKQ